MKIDRISYQKLFPLGAYVNERIGAEGQLDDGEDAIRATKELSDMVHKIHMQLNPHLYTDGQNPLQGFMPKGSYQEISKEQIINEIRQCTDISRTNELGVEVGLLAYVDKGIDDAEIREAYENRMVELIAPTS
jgi:hypothetical protein